VQPPIDEGEQLVYLPGQELRFGYSLIGQTRTVLLYLVRAVEKMGQVGIGRGRGRFKLESLTEYSPLLGTERPLLVNRTVHKPTLAVTAAQISAQAAQMTTGQVMIHFFTPLRLTAREQLVKTPNLVVFMQRLIERCQNLSEHYGAAEKPPDREEWRRLSERLSADAQTVKITEDETRWVEAYSGSRRQGRSTPISGLVGRVGWVGDMRRLLPWILWGQSLHVGKDAVKGNGWYQVLL
jgi:hypothetical protein